MVLEVHCSKYKWTLSSRDRNYAIKEFPADVHAILISHGVFTQQDLYRDENYLKCYDWVVRTDWTYSCTTDLMDMSVAGTQSDEEYFLVLSGIDTVADVFINGQYVQRVDNEFTRHVVSLKRSVIGSKLVDSRQVSLSLHFPSILQHLSKLQCELDYPIPSDHSDALRTVDQISLRRNLVRKCQSSFGWDWGPSICPVGIYGDVKLLCLKPNEFQVFECGICSYLDPAPGITLSLLGLHVSTISSVTLKISQESNGQKCDQSSDSSFNVTVGFDRFKAVQIGEDTIYRCNIDLQRLQLPMHGIRRLFNTGQYCAKVYLNGSSGQVQEFIKPFSFNKIELNQIPGQNDDGQPFTLVVNDNLVFCKGSNMVPLDILPFHFDQEDQYKNLIQNVVAVGINCIRVWAGGRYLPDVFYQLCDQNSIMVWQEFMFTCAMYPVSDQFILNVQKEIVQQILSLQHHACIVLWSGNNENEEAMCNGWFKDVVSNPCKYAVDYHYLYNTVIQTIVRQLDHRPYVSSSPTNGILADGRERFKVQNPHKYGDTHYYNYKDDGTIVHKMPVCRFASEYGFQSMPWFSSLKHVTSPGSWHPLSVGMVHRNHHTNGQPEISLQLSYYFDTDDMPWLIDERAPCSPLQFEKYCIMTQLAQAICVKAQTEHYRRLMPYCMGALYWQLNDVWHASSWSSLQVDGKWKILHNYAKVFFQDVLISSYFGKDGELRVHICNSSLMSYQNVTVEIQVWSIVHSALSTEEAVMLKELSSMQSKDISDSFSESLLADASQNSCVSFMKCLDVDGQVISFNVFYPNAFKLKNYLTKSSVHVEFSDQQCIILKSKDLVPLVVLEHLNECGDVVNFANNAFPLLPNQEVRVKLLPRIDSNVQVNPNDIKIWTLYDLYNEM
ncbi:hypothetical protein MP228_005657 [Amoeboaphelidium protococcarum]|nr:hypothetical protein MP228_005657 [Amoeboaphelidium protococcarum]